MTDPAPAPSALSSLLARVAVGSRNPVKGAAVRTVLGRVAPQATLETVAAASGVPDQPFGDVETIAGARARAIAARAATDADLGVGLKGAWSMAPRGCGPAPGASWWIVRAARAWADRSRCRSPMPSRR